MKSQDTMSTPFQESDHAVLRTKSILKDSQQAESRNPFKKSSNQRHSGGGGGAVIKQGLCFDSIAPPAAASKPRLSSGSQFGARNLNRDLHRSLKLLHVI